MRRVKPALFVLLALIPARLAAAPATKPATQSATTAVPARDPKAAYLAFVQALFDADEKAAFDLLVFADDNGKKEAQAVLGEEIAKRQLDQAYNKAFPPDPRPSSPHYPPNLDGLKEELAAADVTVTGDSAFLKIMGGTVISLARDKGLWKVDFNKTQRAAEGPYDKDKVAAAAARARIFEEFTVDIEAGKYKTRDEANGELGKGLARIAELQPKDNKRNDTIAEIAILKDALKAFEIDNGRFPSTAEGLEALVTNPGLNTWTQRYIDKVPMDKWGRPFIYKGPDTSADGEFDIISLGADGQEGTDDDINKFTKQ